MSLIIRARPTRRACAIVAFAVGTAAGCDRPAARSTTNPSAGSTPVSSTPESSTPPAPAAVRLSPEHAKIVERSEASFDFASYLKPTGEERWAPGNLVPLFGIRVKKDKEKAPPECMPWAVHAPDDDDAPPTLYLLTDQDKIGNDVFERKSYVWFNRDDAALAAPDSVPAALPFTALSLTLDRQGTTIIARVIQSGFNVDRYFVTESMEAAARKQHGPPLAGRRYSIEPAIEKSADASAHEALVPRLMSSVPEPAGPWVYIDGEDGFVTTVLCRCSASQIKAFTEKVEYDIRPVSDVPASIKLPDLSAPSAAALRLPTAIP